MANRKPQFQGHYWVSYNDSDRMPWRALLNDHGWKELVGDAKTGMEQIVLAVQAPEYWWEEPKPQETDCDKRNKAFMDDMQLELNRMQKIIDGNK